MFMEEQMHPWRGNIVDPQVKFNIFCRYKKEKNIYFEC